MKKLLYIYKEEQNYIIITPTEVITNFWVITKGWNINNNNDNNKKKKNKK